ncbi:MAG: DUF4255 domain-containing protein [Gammaproteobacteria bacterium]|nr:MAG: DUF4255 domain-containing protein [Gammaproteobacteria bacterium]
MNFMINETLTFFKNSLNDYLQAKSSNTLDEIQEDRVVFIEGEKLDPISFKMDAISLLLINLEEEKSLRAPDLYSRTDQNGTSLKTQPEIRLNLYILFVARFKQYENSLDHISLIIQFFQSNRVLNQHNSPNLSNKIHNLSVELITLPFGEQNEIWSALRTTYHPSVLYKVKMLVFADKNALSPPKVSSKDTSLREIT